MPNPRPPETPMPGTHAKPQTGFRMHPALKDAATRKARAEGGPGSLNAAVEQLLQAWVDGTITLSAPAEASL